MHAVARTTVERTVIVQYTIAPVITGYCVSPDTYGPPNHEMFDVAAVYTATDASATTSCGLEVTSNEAANALGDGSTSVDWRVISPTLVQLRAERSGRGSAGSTPSWSHAATRPAVRRPRLPRVTIAK